MSSVPATSGGRPAGYAWFLAWVAVGAAVALAAISLGPLALVPAAAVAALLLARPAGRQSAFGAVAGVGVLLLYVAYVNRDGPGTTCWRTAAASGCDQHLNPLPWLVIGLLLVITGFVAHARTGRPRD